MCNICKKRKDELFFPHEKGEGNLVGREKCARGVIVIVVENGHGDTSSNPGRD